ncbi:MAG: peptidylprolyl isomerase [Prevotella sp.]|nr:peptidylprolyl isomerase [Prevotella sp.]
MKSKTLLVAMLLCGTIVQAQNDPTIMTINGQPVGRSEFEYSYNKNNAEGVIDKKSVDEYVDLFINYKLKVQAALDAQLDTMKSFQKEFRTYRDQQIRPSLVTDADVEVEAKKYYDDLVKQIGPRGLFTASHILLRLDEQASQSQQDSVKARIDSVYNAIKNGADFAELAMRLSDDEGSGRNGGLLPTLAPGQTVREFEDVAYSLKDGEMSQPFLSPFGYHIIKMKERSQVPAYDSLRTNIVQFLESRGVREKIVDEKLEEQVKSSNGSLTAESILDAKSEELEAQDPEIKNLIREYHDGLLLFEISNQTIWDKAAKDDVGLEQFFKKNKKKYKWDSPRFKGIAYHVKTQSDVKAVRDCVKGLPFNQWADKLRKTFNNDSIIRIRVEKGIFKQGDNQVIDKMVFKQNVELTPLENYPIDATFGQKLSAPKTYEDVRALVTADYQDVLEKEWVAELRKKYQVSVNKDVLATVNKHDE